MAELEEISRKQGEIHIKISGCVMFANHLDVKVQELVTLTGGFARSSRHRPDAAKPFVIVCITIASSTIRRKKYRQVIEQWFASSQQTFMAMTHELRAKSQIGIIPSTIALAVHSEHRT
jgi:hypothetical protein